MFKCFFSLLFVFVLTLSYNLFANEEMGMSGKGEISPEQLSAVKEQRIKHLDEKINALTEIKSCVSDAANRDGLKACNKKMKEMHDSYKEKREEMKMIKSLLRWNKMQNSLVEQLLGGDIWNVT